MAAQQIDELQLLIGSDATKAIEQLGLLADSLDRAATSANKLASATAAVNAFAGSLGTLASTDFKSTISDLRRLSRINLSNLENKNFNIDVTVNGGDAVGDIDRLSDAMSGLARSGRSSGTPQLSQGQAILANSIMVGARAAADEVGNLTRKVVELGGKGVSALGSFMSKLNLIPSHTSSIDRMALSFGNLLRAVLPFYGLRGLFDWAKESFELGTSVVEMENVIDVAFGHLGKGYEDLSGHIYDWSKTTLDSFGVSELAALKYAGRLQSIFNSSGFDLSEGMRDYSAQMTTDLIERAGDIASFYDISVDEAMTKMQAGLVGMARPMRSLGVNMTVANMEAYALSQGINTSWKEMDQASQMALRYRYILDATKYAEGDFGRTSGRELAPCYREVA